MVQLPVFVLAGLLRVMGRAKRVSDRWIGELRQIQPVGPEGIPVRKEDPRWK
jgi:hypothetical protein